jgi:hypothetical protein
MPDNEPLPKSEAKATDDPIKARVKKLLEDYPRGPFNEVVRVGFRALDDGDLQLAKAAAEHVIERAPPSTGDILRAYALRAFVYDKQGDRRRSAQLLEDVVGRDF